MFFFSSPSSSFSSPRARARIRGRRRPFTSSSPFLFHAHACMRKGDEKEISPLSFFLSLSMPPASCQVTEVNSVMHKISSPLSLALPHFTVTLVALHSPSLLHMYVQKFLAHTQKPYASMLLTIERREEREKGDRRENIE